MCVHVCVYMCMYVHVCMCTLTWRNTLILDIRKASSILMPFLTWKVPEEKATQTIRMSFKNGIHTYVYPNSLVHSIGDLTSTWYPTASFL